MPPGTAALFLTVRYVQRSSLAINGCVNLHTSPIYAIKGLSSVRFCPTDRGARRCPLYDAHDISLDGEREPSRAATNAHNPSTLRLIETTESLARATTGVVNIFSVLFLFQFFFCLSFSSTYRVTHSR